MTFNFDSETNYHAFLDRLGDLELDYLDNIEELSVDVPDGDYDQEDLEQIAEECGGWRNE